MYKQLTPTIIYIFMFQNDTKPLCCGLFQLFKKAVFKLFIFWLMFIQYWFSKPIPFHFYFPKSLADHFSQAPQSLGPYREIDIHANAKRQTLIYTHTKWWWKPEQGTITERTGVWAEWGEVVLSLLELLGILGGNDWKPLSAGVFTKRISHGVVKQAWWINSVQWWDAAIDQERRGG